MLNRCRKCKEILIWDDSVCKCEPFDVKLIDIDYEKTIHGFDIEDAIEKDAKHRFWQDPCDPHHVEYVYEHDGKRYRVDAEPDVNFYVRDAK